MAKLILRESCFKGMDNVIIKEIKKTSAHKTFVKQANEQIERNRLKYAIAYNRAESYLSDQFIRINILQNSCKKNDGLVS